MTKKEHLKEMIRLLEESGIADGYIFDKIKSFKMRLAQIKAIETQEKSWNEIIDYFGFSNKGNLSKEILEHLLKNYKIQNK